MLYLGVTEFEETKEFLNVLKLFHSTWKDEIWVDHNIVRELSLVFALKTAISFKASFYVSGYFQFSNNTWI